jgi:hypothetical protein
MMSKDLMAFILVAMAVVIIGVLLALKTIAWDAGGPILAGLVAGAVMYLFPSPAQQ